MRLLFLWLLVAAPLPAAQENNTQTIESALGALEKSKTCFDNLQAEWEEVRDESGSQTKLHHRYWSRTGEYFRIDSKIEDALAAPSEPANQRIIVRPEGYVRMTSPQSRPLAIADFGSPQEGMSRLYPNVLFQANQRGSLANVGDVLKSVLSEKPAYAIESVTKNDNSVVVILSASNKNTLYVYEYTVDTIKGVCTAWKETAKQDGRVLATTSITKSYKDSCVPQLIRIESDEAGKKSKRTFRLLNCQEVAAELPIFSLDAQGVSQGSVWVRRLVIFGVGAALFGVYFSVRQLKKNRA